MMNRTILAWYCVGLICKPHSVPDYWMPVNYGKAGKTSGNCKSEIELYVGNLTSDGSNTEYKYDNFDFCKANAPCIPSENLGQTRFNGEERVPLSPYKMEFLRDVKCATVCRREYSGSDYETIKKLEILRKGIALNYYHHWTVDNIAVTWCPKLHGWSYCVTEIPMGTYYEPDTYYLFNHVDLTITYSRLKEESNSTFKENGGRIISVTAVPRSIKHGSNPDCESEVPLEIPNAKFPPDQQLSVTYTYSIKFIENNTLKRSSRRNYTSESMIPVERDAGLFASSLITVLFLSGIVAVIMCYTLPIIRYKQVELEENPRKESGWRVIRNDVFRPPRNGLLLSAFLGSGATVFLMCFITLVLVSIGVVSTTREKELTFCAMLSYACLSSVAGYVSAVIYKSFFGKKYKWNMLLTSMITSSIVIGLLFNYITDLWAYYALNAQILTRVIAAGVMWLGVCVSMTYTGAYFGFRRKPLECLVATNQMPRQIPKQKFYKHPLPYIIMGGALPFGCMFEYKFLPLNYLSSTEVSTRIIFLLKFLVLVITCSETAILFCYFHLCAENYHWWWRSFLTSSSTAFYFSIYILFNFIQPRVNATLFLDVVTNCTVAFLFFLLTGSIGFFACLWFVRKIYSVEKDRTSSLSTNNDVPNPKQLRDMPYAHFDLCEEASTSQQKEETTKKHPNTADTKL